ncbi:DUF4251 domain-containing protein [Gelidibacter maritimus]|uniref:DUF4251 domain-containing protein n=1 Tax=Gelidibacter maritimus TaxID=2761487 RepID=A0A7W2M7N8_9FLAO|nr:DUF4251 domain-containing protein [Gelidibacter maritimus]MBA6154142.1 DUF4251 domain-containing protein [Gelidibacter maritimus]
MKNLLVSSIIFICVMGCSSSKEFTEQDSQDYQQLQELVASKSFEIISTSAMPRASAAFSKVANSNILGPGSNASHIDITSNSNRLVVKGDSIRGNLPFFGEQNFGGGYGGNHTGIEFDDIPEDYKVKYNDQKHTAEIRFKISDKYRGNENYDMMITLYPNNRSTIRVQSTNRSSIQYNGKVTRLEEAME